MNSFFRFPGIGNYFWRSILCFRDNFMAQEHSEGNFHNLHANPNLPDVFGPWYSSLLPGSMYSKCRRRMRTAVRSLGLMKVWRKRLISNASTICYWMPVRDHLPINCRFVQGQCHDIVALASNTQTRPTGCYSS